MLNFRHTFFIDAEDYAYYGREVKIEGDTLRVPTGHAYREDAIICRKGIAWTNEIVHQHGLESVLIEWFPANSPHCPYLAHTGKGLYVYVKTSNTAVPSLDVLTGGVIDSTQKPIRFKDGFLYYDPDAQIAPEKLCRSLSGTGDCGLDVSGGVRVFYDEENIAVQSQSTHSDSTSFTKLPDTQLEVAVFTHDDKTSDTYTDFFDGALFVADQPFPRELMLGSHGPIKYLNDDLPDFGEGRTRAQDRSWYLTHVQNPVGLHPKLEIEYNVKKAPEGQCKLYSLWTLPKDVFIDRNQFDLHGLVELYGETDLELPAYAIEGWGSVLLQEIVDDSPFVVPLHSRYETPNKEPFVVKVPEPLVFYACEKPESLVDTATSAFQRPEPFYMSFFPKHVIYHLAARGTGVTIGIPTLDPGHAGQIEVFTVGTIVIGFLYLLIRLSGVILGSSEAKKPKKD
ncbi:hypothetical protein CANCADRAFT_106301 [Tortispora caseinolytica NRRL Y-17796]|uniref:Protein PBN1 n=1 Tax=Tortispora caseinolytica NRRL Y-17796 TaxID=767744 RepID=A0A1E4TFC5_9ASCO|nr:hypothetical protein CANCADRAFT_106301 [Tortispora caseinolytica NRRL Y-17796]